MSRFNSLTVLCASFMLAAPASTFAERWNRLSTVERVISAAGTILSQRQVGPTAQRQAVRSVAIRELEELLRNRSRGANTRPQQPSGTRRTSTTRGRGDVYGSLVMPVAGVSWDELQDSFGDARSGGRSHQGIDIFAPRWTEALAATSGYLTSIGSGERSGRSVWLVGNDGRSYFYAHLQDWARGISNGTTVRAGEVIGYVGNSGNASSSPTHLHFEMRDQYGRTVNPYRQLANAATMEPSEQIARAGRSQGSRGK